MQSRSKNAIRRRYHLRPAGVFYVGVTVILLTCAYKGAEFLRVGYYVSNEVLGY